MKNDDHLSRWWISPVAFVHRSDTFSEKDGEVGKSNQVPCMFLIKGVHSCSFFSKQMHEGWLNAMTYPRTRIGAMCSSPAPIVGLHLPSFNTGSTVESWGKCHSNNNWRNTSFTHCSWAAYQFNYRGLPHLWPWLITKVKLQAHPLITYLSLLPTCNLDYYFLIGGSYRWNYVEIPVFFKL